jgi:hypothetical protein
MLTKHLVLACRGAGLVTGGPSGRREGLLNLKVRIHDARWDDVLCAHVSRMCNV